MFKKIALLSAFILVMGLTTAFMAERSDTDLSCGRSCAQAQEPAAKTCCCADCQCTECTCSCKETCKDGCKCEECKCECTCKSQCGQDGKCKK